MDKGDAFQKPAAAIGDPPPLPDGAPPLDADNLDDFLAWAARVPRGQVDAIRERIAAARGDQELVDRLLRELSRSPVEDVARHRVLLNVMGELRDGRVAGELARFVWGEITVKTNPIEGRQGCGFEATAQEVLQARAAEMLSYIATDEATEETLRIASEHPSLSVRAAAIDAHLFNHDDAETEMERLRSRVRAEDAPLIGVARFKRDADPREFERSVAVFYERHPEQRAPRPTRPAGTTEEPS